MQLRWQILYNEFNSTIKECEKNAASESLHVEECFRIALDYWHRLKTEIGTVEGISIKEQIAFSKPLNLYSPAI